MIRSPVDATPQTTCFRCAFSLTRSASAVRRRRSGNSISVSAFRIQTFISYFISGRRFIIVVGTISRTFKLESTL